MANVEEFLGNVAKTAGEIIGFDSGKISSAFVTNAVEMGIDAVNKSRATSAKGIINMAIKKGELDEAAIKGLQETLKGPRGALIEEAGKIAKNSNIQDEVFKKAATDFIGKTDAYNKIMKKNGATAADINAFLGKKGDTLSPLTKLQGFYGNEELGRTRKTLVRGGVVGAAIGARVLSGGNLTTNSRGEHDIAGIPFF